MCGIAGHLEYRPHAFKEDLITKMAWRLAHRGPDGDGIHRDGPVALAHRRLAILDLSDKASQPFLDSASGDAITFNGEIYNYRDLREDLKSHGHEFRSQSDTEVLFRGLQTYGIEFLTQTEGDFALAYWNSRERLLWLARDRFGVKPVYYAELPSGMIFASEAKAILEADYSFHLNSEALESYMTRRYAPGAQTPWREIQKVAPGSALAFNSSGKVREVRFWTLASESIGTRDGIGDDLRQSVRHRLESDVPIGCLLSGGIDSSAICELMTEEYTRSVQTFTIDIQDGAQEAAQAQELAAILGCEHHSFPPSQAWHEGIEQIVYHLEEPLGDSSLLPTYQLSEKVAKFVKVVMSGEGADEIFGGYAHQRLLFLTEKFRELTPSLARHLLSAMTPALAGPWMRNNPLYPVAVETEMVRRFGDLIRRAPDLPHDEILVSSLFTARERSKLLRGSLGDDPLISENRRRLEPYARQSLAHRLLVFDLRGWLPDYGLLRVDRLSMAHGLEVRLPYLNHRLVEEVWRHSERDLFQFRQRKPLIRSYARGRTRLTKIAERPKHPLHFPVEAERQQSVWQWANQILTPERIRQFDLLDPKGIEDFLQSFRPTYLGFKKLFWLTFFQLWSETYLTGRWRQFGQRG